jgi:hypothetical protein
MRVAADIYRRVLAEPVLSMVYGEEMLAWAYVLESNEVSPLLITSVLAVASDTILGRSAQKPTQWPIKST